MKSLLKLLLPNFVIKLILFFKDNGKFVNHNHFTSSFYPENDKPMNSLDLGCGSEIRNPFGAKNTFGLEIEPKIESLSIKKCDLGIEKIPFNDSFFEVISAFDLIEHIPRVAYLGNEKKFPFIFLMNEIFRCLKINGIFFSVTPSYPHSAAFHDPTHVNFITSRTFEYFCSDENKPYAERYGFTGNFQIIKQGWDGQNLVTLMKKRV